MNVEKIIEKLKREDSRFRKEYEEENIAFEVGNMVMSARIEEGISQEELAKKVGTKQPSIARVESGSNLPSLSFLKKIADALNTKMILPQFKNIYSEHEEAQNHKETVIYSFFPNTNYTEVSGSVASTEDICLKVG